MLHEHIHLNITIKNLQDSIVHLVNNIFHKQEFSENNKDAKQVAVSFHVQTIQFFILATIPTLDFHLKIFAAKSCQEVLDNLAKAARECNCISDTCVYER